MAKCSLRGHKCGQQKHALRLELLSNALVEEIGGCRNCCSLQDPKRASSAFPQLSEASCVGVWSAYSVKRVKIVDRYKHKTSTI